MSSPLSPQPRPPVPPVGEPIVSITTPSPLTTLLGSDGGIGFHGLNWSQGVTLSELAQKNAFLSSEGDKWFDRNAAVLSANTSDPTIDACKHLNIKPLKVLEIGCANGWRLKHYADEFGSDCSGIEPSSRAVETGSGNPLVNLQVGTADSLPFPDGSFDLVIFGFCLYLVDPKLHFKAVAEADRVLVGGGALIIVDFLPPTPFFNDYGHQAGLRSHKMQFANYFLANPAYSLWHRSMITMGGPNDLESVDVLMKNLDTAFPINPYSIA